MENTKTIDAKGLEHSKREELIFPNVEALKEGEVLRIILEFNPLPLVYLLKAENEFEVTYEKEGPKEWILNVKRIKDKEDTKQHLKELLQELKTGVVSDEMKEKAKGILRAVDAKTLGLVEQELIREGVSHETIRKSLCDIHMEVLKDSLVSKRIEVFSPHPVHTLMEEHKEITANLKELAQLAARIKDKKSYEDLGEDLEKLKDIAHHLVEAESHHQREEEVLFPKLEKHDITEPPAIMKEDHAEFKKKKQELYALAHKPEGQDFEVFKTKVIELGETLSRELESHIFKEDNILYQIALQVLTEEDWREVKKECDRIGYCCFTPEDRKEGKVIELDLRPMPPFERHDRIFKMWEALQSGQTLKLINDHDPRPLRYQFEAEYKDVYEWEYEQKGPRDWKVNIKKR